MNYFSGSFKFHLANLDQLLVKSLCWIKLAILVLFIAELCVLLFALFECKFVVHILISDMNCL